MQLHLSPSMRSIAISSSNSGNGKVAGLMKIKVAARHFSYGILFQIIILLAVLLPFVFILTALGTLEGCLTRPWGPSFLGREVDSERLVRDFYMILNDINNLAISDDFELPDSFNQLVTDMKNNNYNARTFAVVLRAMGRYWITVEQLRNAEVHCVIFPEELPLCMSWFRHLWKKEKKMLTKKSRTSAFVSYYSSWLRKKWMRPKLRGLLLVI